MSDSGERANCSLLWTEMAPAVEKLSSERSRFRFRISDWDLYDRQMKELLGLVPAS